MRSVGHAERSPQQTRPTGQAATLNRCANGPLVGDPQGNSRLDPGRLAGRPGGGGQGGKGGGRDQQGDVHPGDGERDAGALEVVVVAEQQVAGDDRQGGAEQDALEGDERALQQERPPDHRGREAEGPEHAHGAAALADGPDHDHPEAGHPDHQPQGQEALEELEEGPVGGEVLLDQVAHAGRDQALGQELALEVGGHGLVGDAGGQGQQRRRGPGPVPNCSPSPPAAITTGLPATSGPTASKAVESARMPPMTLPSGGRCPGRPGSGCRPAGR